jgi:hypothetical protein
VFCLVLTSNISLLQAALQLLEQQKPARCQRHTFLLTACLAHSLYIQVEIHLCQLVNLAGTNALKCNSSPLRCVSFMAHGHTHKAAAAAAGTSNSTAASSTVARARDSEESVIIVSSSSELDADIALDEAERKPAISDRIASGTVGSAGAESVIIVSSSSELDAELFLDGTERKHATGDRIAPGTVASAGGFEENVVIVSSSSELDADLLNEAEREGARRIARAAAALQAR